MTATQSSATRRSSARFIVWAALLIAVALSAWLAPRGEKGGFPGQWNLGLRQPIDELQSWIVLHRETLPLFQYFFDPLSDVIDAGLRWAENVVLALPWIVLVAGFVLTGLGLGGWRLAALCFITLITVGLFGLWEPSLQTLALMIVSVAASVLIGLPLGILSAFSDRFDKFLRPILDAMQTMPTFVYLIPVVLFFGIARVPAVVATLIYAVPPVIRLTNLGLREVNPTIVEAARAFGSTRWQMLFKVQLPLALPSVLAGVNQTIMMALSMVVIAALIGAGGLGREVLVSLQRLQVGKALEAGLAIVLLAIMTDRLSEALGKLDLSEHKPRRGLPPRWWPERWEAGYLAAMALLETVAQLPAAGLAALFRRPALRRYAGLINTALILLALLLADAFIHFGAFPSGWRWQLRQPTDALVLWLRDNWYEVPLGTVAIGTGPLSDFVTIYLLNAMRALFTVIVPWPLMVAGTALLAQWAGGWRLALFSGAGVFLIGWLGMWPHSMETLSQIVVTMLFTVLIAIPLGLWSSQNDTVRDVLRPTLDFLQTIPSFVFLVPVIMLFNIGRVPGIIAAVLYAIPPGIKLTDLGVRQVPAETVEAARAFGSTRAQMLAKVQIPLALPSILLGVNQMIMMVLAMVIISAMVGGAGVGLEAVNGLSRNEPGRGFEAGIAIVLMAIITDRITQAIAKKQ